MIEFDAIKCSYRQTKDGHVIGLVIHPQDMSPELANAEIGTQFKVTLTPLDEDGNAPEEA